MASPGKAFMFDVAFSADIESLPQILHALEEVDLGARPDFKMVIRCVDGWEASNG